jgi:hypothetical protein
METSAKRHLSASLRLTAYFVSKLNTVAAVRETIGWFTKRVSEYTIIMKIEVNHVKCVHDIHR